LSEEKGRVETTNERGRKKGGVREKKEKEGGKRETKRSTTTTASLPLSLSPSRVEKRELGGGPLEEKKNGILSFLWVWEKNANEKRKKKKRREFAWILVARHHRRGGGGEKALREDREIKRTGGTRRRLSEGEGERKERRKSPITRFRVSKKEN